MATRALASDEGLSHTYVLHVWREHPNAPWRASLRASGSQERIGFADLEQLAIFLFRLTEQRPLPGSDPAPGDPTTT
ncbi:MAG TPA: hypothetical protein PLO33_12705 [Kouleothrix sp.]|uniref:hypothetical protein n=1 Tax=Kouleothrix sp. TaxID=2779161 RepID=UPI002BAEA65E|nr:hypothetical protein [Kouleothrix sp.]HRC76529.1 hypothetical protein [Kouleothrix sp.]